MEREHRRARRARETVECAGPRRGPWARPGLRLCRHPGAPRRVLLSAPGPRSRRDAGEKAWETPGSRSGLPMGMRPLTKVRLLLKGRARGRYPASLAVEPDVPFTSKASRGTEAAS